MTDLNFGQGAFPDNWGVPASLYNYETHTYDSGGYVWMGDDPDTRQDDVMALVEWSAPFPPEIDVPTLFGQPPYSERAADWPMYNQTVTLGAPT